MGDTENGSWGSRELGGYIWREEARKDWEQIACTCGHNRERHEIEPPYPCYDCECGSFDLPKKAEAKP